MLEVIRRIVAAGPDLASRVKRLDQQTEPMTLPSVRSAGMARGVGGAAGRKTKTHTGRRWLVLDH